MLLYVKNTYICLMGLPNEVAATTGRPLSICVENWMRSIWTPELGVTSPSNNASTTNGTAGSSVTVAVGEATGVAVMTKLVAACVGVSSGASVSVTVEAGCGEEISNAGISGSVTPPEIPAITTAIPATINAPRP
jgi:hypothetical protein